MTSGREATDNQLRKRIAELESSLKRTDTLFLIAEAGIHSQTLPELIALVVEKIAQGTSANRVSLITLNVGEKKIEHFSRGGPGARQINTQVSYQELMEGLSGWALQNKKSALSPKNKPDPRESIAVQKRRVETNCGSIIVTPVQHRGEILGTVTVINNPEDPDFTSRDVLLIEAAAGQAAEAIVKASLYDELERANRLLQEHSNNLEREIAERIRIEREMADRAVQLTALNQLSRNIISTFDLDEIYTFAHQTVKQLMPVDAFYITLVNEQKKTAEYVYMFDKGKRYPIEQTSLSEQNLTTYVIDTKQPLLIEDDADGTSRRLGGSLFGTSEETRSILIFPLLQRDKVIGVISAQHYQPNRYTAKHAQVLELLANQLAIAILNARLYSALKQEAIRDPLTGLFNRRLMAEALKKELLRAKRNNSNLAIALLDIDHFKQINDSFGHQAGDSALRLVAAILDKKTRGSDIAFRYGGEEFALIMPGISANAAYQRMEQLRQEMKQISLKYRKNSVPAITCSIGIATFPEHGTTSETILKAADTALYRAKNNGRDQVFLAG